MILLKKLSFTMAAGVLMLAQGLASKAVTFTLDVPSATLTGAASNTFFTGVNSAAGVYNAALFASGTTPINNQSTVSYGTTLISLNPGKTNPNADVFNNALATFTFDVTANGVTNHFLVSGVIRDVAGGTSTNANGDGSTGDDFVAQSIRVNGGFTYTNVVTSPNLRVSVRANGIQFGSTFADIYVEQLNGLTAPTTNFNFGNALTVGGYIGLSVPEPGAMAMLIGAGISGAGLLLRRRTRKAA